MKNKVKSSTEFQHFRKLDAFDIYEDLGKRKDGYSKVCFVICKSILENMKIEPTAEAFFYHQIGMIMSLMVDSGKVEIIGINIDGIPFEFRDFLMEDNDEKLKVE